MKGFNACRARKIKDNQSVENAGVAFVKGAHERNEFLKKYTILTNKYRRTRQSTNNLREELIW